MEAKYESAVIESLENAFGELRFSNPFSSVLFSAAENAAADNVQDYFSDLMLCREDSALEHLSEDEAENIFSELIRNSIAYMLFARCGDEIDLFIPEHFTGLKYFNTPQTVNALGTAVGDISKTLLLEISSTILSMERDEKKRSRTFAKEEAANYDEAEESIKGGLDHEHNLHNAGRLQYARSENGGRAGSDLGQVRRDEAQIFREPPQGAVHKPADIGQADRPLSGDRADSEGARGEDRVADGADRGRERGTQSERSDEMDGADEQSHPFSGGDRAERADIQLTSEQPEPSEEAESSELPAFFVEEDIWSVLKYDRYMHTKRPEIAAYFDAHSDEDERTTFLKNSYNMDVYSELLAEEKRFGYIARDNGLTMWEGSYLSRTSESTFSWDIVQGLIADMIARGNYLDIPAPIRLPWYRCHCSENLFTSRKRQRRLRQRLFPLPRLAYPSRS